MHFYTYICVKFGYEINSYFCAVPNTILQFKYEPKIPQYHSL